MPNTNPRKQRILVIDDENEMRSIIADTLTAAGYEVMTAASGAEGFNLHRTRQADLIVLDMVLPEKDGVEMTVQFLRTFPNVRILAISGAITNECLLRAAERLGATATLSKPFHPEDLVKAVAGALK